MKRLDASSTGQAKSGRISKSSAENKRNTDSSSFKDLFSLHCEPALKLHLDNSDNGLDDYLENSSGVKSDSQYFAFESCFETLGRSLKKQSRPSPWTVHPNPEEMRVLPTFMENEDL